MDDGTIVEIFHKKKQKAAIKDIPKYGLFRYRKQVWRSLGKLIETSHSVTAQKVFATKQGYEVCTENADFSEHFLVEPYEGDLEYVKPHEGASPSDYQCSIDIKRVR